ncbi:sulfurtransferase [Sporomusa sp. KB1]|uniref:sulfurtransferase n=1 Tax=Sporomusa sp. KB1 TaxID=943346 RepID=UPI0011A73EC9|nr:sulfurtransferase [Sporomusa sp. KB1]TWH49022.1 thiosulfate/3-mercaptopyruvate sulfurtransferase [Sporomusa sp. KB1]
MPRRKSICTKTIFVSLLVAIFVSISLCPQIFGATANANAADSRNQGFINKDSLITPIKLNDLMKDRTVKIIDVRSPERYQKEHLPEAVNTWWKDYEDEKGLIPSPERFAALLSKLGINNKDTIVLYADSDKHGPAYVAHFWWLLDMFGYHNVKMLDGGLEAWQASGYKLSNEISKVDSGNFRLTRIDTSKLATTEEVWTAVKKHDSNVIILDVREWEEFSGSIQAPGAVRKGRIPGAVWLYWGDVLNPDKTLKNAGELRKIFTAKGITPGKTVITYCQAGVRAAHTAYVLSEVLGYKNVKNYAGSWIEWSQREELPIEIDGQ